MTPSWLGERQLPSARLSPVCPATECTGTAQSRGVEGEAPSHPRPLPLPRCAPHLDVHTSQPPPLGDPEASLLQRFSERFVGFLRCPWALPLHLLPTPEPRGRGHTEYLLMLISFGDERVSSHVEAQRSTGVRNTHPSPSFPDVAKRSHGFPVERVSLVPPGEAGWHSSKKGL